MKKEYNAPECSVVYFENEDIVTSSLLSSDANPNSPTGDILYDKFFGSGS